MSWRELQLGDVVRLKRGHDLPTSTRIAGDVPIISSSGITGFHNVAKVIGPGVVTGRYGTLGEVHYIEGEYWPLNTALYVEDFKGNYPRFIAYLLSTLELGKQNAAGAVPGVNRNALHQLPVRVPNFETQVTIAETLNLYDDLIETNHRRMVLLEESARQLYREWFVKLRFPGYESVNVVDGIPDGWQKASLGTLIKTSSGGTPSRSRPEFYGEGFPWVKTKELNDGYILETEEQITTEGLSHSSAKLFPKKTVLLAMYGATIGKTAILGLPAATNQACCAFLTADTPFLSEYIFIWLGEMKNVLIGLGMGAAQPNLSQEIIHKVEFTMPSNHVLNDFGTIVGDLFDQICVLTHLNFNLVKARDALLPKLMSGQLAV